MQIFLLNFYINRFNLSVENSEFPSILKIENITPVYKKGERDCKDNYRPVSIFSNVSKIFERCMLEQISNYMNYFLSKFQCVFRKVYSTQYCLLALLEKFKSAIDKGNLVAALITYLSKAFDCLSHEFLLAKLHAYGFSFSALRFVRSYLKNRKQRTKINSEYRKKWEEIIFGVPQGSILLFNIFICDLFFIMNETDFANYADDTTPYVTGNNLDDVMKKLENHSNKLFRWFEENQMKANKDKVSFDHQ